MGTVRLRGGVNEPGGGRVSVFLGSDGCFRQKMPKMGCVNSVVMRFSITIFTGRVSDFRLKGGVAPPEGLRRE